jgi:hypothetical protein
MSKNQTPEYNRNMTIQNIDNNCFSIINRSRLYAISGLLLVAPALIAQVTVFPDKVGIMVNQPSEALDVNGKVIVGGSDLILGTRDGRAQGTLLGNRALSHSQTNDGLIINFNGDFENGVTIMGPQVVISGNAKVEGRLSVKGTTGFFIDESTPYLPAGSAVVEDSTANGGKVIKRLATAGGGTVWFGPYQPLPAGSYVVQVRAKVASNTSTNRLFTLDAYIDSKRHQFTKVEIRPSDFSAPDKWQILSFPLSIDKEYSAHPLEIRGMSFVSGITDISIDYINIVAGDIVGYFSPEFTITPSGNMGVGITYPTHKLTVNGPIRAKEVIVDTGWADDVFSSDYRLASLKEVEAHIGQEGRLPGMPSAKEVAENGLSVGEAQSLLLRKIEELTLHVIRLEKKNEQLEQKLTEIRKPQSE